jgi:diadenosine tetraphosphate (Ap4A) HIT family hydrolase
MSECIFCSIVRNKTPATRVYENDDVVVIMDRKPITQGHMLVLPKVHRELLTEMDDESITAMFAVAKVVGNALKKSKLRCRGINYLLADGAEAGQEVFHVHLHIIPRYRGDGFYLHMPPSYERETDLKDLEKAAGRIRTALEK